MPGPLDHTGARRSPAGAGASSHADEPQESFDVRFWKIRTYKGKRGQTYAVRWKVGGQEHHETYQTKAHAESRLAELRSYARQGVAFDVTTGLPISEVKKTWAAAASEDQ